jgi:hypothetical protein
MSIPSIFFTGMGLHGSMAQYGVTNGEVPSNVLGMRLFV